MEKYIPIEKRSKKEKQALAKVRRGSWGALNPVTRKPANPKAYNRKKSRHEEEFFNDGICFSFTGALHPEDSPEYSRIGTVNKNPIKPR